jgi:hypothetical protein
MVVTCEITSSEPEKVAGMLYKRGFKRVGLQWQFHL